MLVYTMDKWTKFIILLSHGPSLKLLHLCELKTQGDNLCYICIYGQMNYFYSFTIIYGLFQRSCLHYNT